MTILVCPQSQAGRVVEARSPERIVSLLDPDATFPEFGSPFSGGHLRLRFHDVHLSTASQVAPNASHIEAFLAFLSDWQRTGPLLLHCRAGLGRSPAAAFIAACFLAPAADESEVARALRRISPMARPNESLVALADSIIGRGGRMTTAIAETGRGLPWPAVKEGLPFELPAVFQRNQEPAAMAAPDVTAPAKRGSAPVTRMTQ